MTMTSRAPLSLLPPEGPSLHWRRRPFQRLADALASLPRPRHRGRGLHFRHRQLPSPSTYTTCTLRSTSPPPPSSAARRRVHNYTCFLRVLIPRPRRRPAALRRRSLHQRRGRFAASPPIVASSPSRGPRRGRAIQVSHGPKAGEADGGDVGSSLVWHPVAAVAVGAVPHHDSGPISSCHGPDGAPER